MAATPNSATENVIAAMIKRIVQQFDPLRIILFGSQARGDAGPWSDVDLLIVLPEVANKREAAVEVRRALVDFTVSKDIIVTTPDEIERRGDLVGTILRPALREGKVLYERN
ncbi:MAG TPA: nucleotidyltransferase domain-containing protein [Anaerolineae bacterium]|nr:nucleotidyltransferase domain-containing protein [Anaerolineae bacterium]HQH37678.1 nucleotidyltransferase domain-containing protein [Anaerolineae bacterium]